VKQEVELGVGFVDKLSAESSTRNIYRDEYRIRVLAIWTKRAKASGELIANRRVLTRYRRGFGISTETKGVF
jgi:hypothetical protein